GFCIIQNKRGEDVDFVNTAWTVQVIRGLSLWFGSGLLAWPMAYYYEQPTLLWLLPVCGLMALIGGFDSTAIYSLGRKLVRGPVVLLDLSTQVVCSAVAIAWALWQPTVLALVIGGIASAVVRTILSHAALAESHNRFRWERTAWTELVGFGKWVFLSSTLTFVAYQADRLIIGKLTSMETLGLYHIAAMLVALPTSLMGSLTSQLLFPLYSRLLQVGCDVRGEVVRFRTLMASLAILFVSLMIVSGPTAIRLLYDERYAGSGDIFRFLAVNAWIQMLLTMGGSFLLALGQIRWITVGHL